MTDLFNLGEYLKHYPSLLIIISLVSILLVGIIGHLLSNKTNLPAIIFFMFFGIILGKYGLNLINPDVFGDNGIRAIISICVAIIVFEGGLLINLNNLRMNFVSIINLITLNVLITILSVTYITYFILDIDFKIALLYASLVSVTGPTVINPIIKKLHLNKKVKIILESESILVDAVGVIAAASIFNYVTLSQDSTLSFILTNIFTSLFLGALSGFACVYAAKKIIKRFSSLSSEIVNMITLSVAISSYMLGELLSHESGIMAVAIAGIIIGNSNFPFKRAILDFKNDLTLISITIVFLILSTQLDLSFLLSLGYKAPLVVIILMFIIRPLGVFLSTITEKINYREKIFIAFLGPRGIVAASAATFFSIELKAFGIEGSEMIKSLVFLTILMTVIIEGGGAKKMSKILNISPLSILIIGGGYIGKELALKFKEKDKSIIVVENNLDKIDSLSKLGLYVVNADITSSKTYKDEFSLENIKSVITTTEDDWLNLRACQVIKKIKPEIECISIINDLKGKTVFENFGIKTVNLRESAVKVIHYELMEKV